MQVEPMATRNAICLCADARMMIPAMFVAGSVLAMSSRNDVPFDIHVFSEPSEVTDLQRAWMESNGIRLYTDFDLSAYHGLFDRPGNRLSAATLTRLFLPSVLQNEYDRILYLDADLTIHDDIAQIFTLDLGEHAFAAVRTGSTWRNPQERADAESHFASLGMTEPYRYFNSGVLLVDVREWLARGISENALEFVHTSFDKCRLVDEDALNATVDGEFCSISPLWNMAPGMTLAQYKARTGWPIIVHHMGGTKPWRLFARRRSYAVGRYYYDLYRSFLEGTPWEEWLSEQWTLRDFGKYLEWEVATAVRSLTRRSQHRAHAEAAQRYWAEEHFADVEQGLVIRENGILRLQHESKVRNVEPGQVPSGSEPG